MGTFAEYIGTMDIPENRRTEYARQMLRLLHAGGMMSVDEVGLFSHCIRLLYPPELDRADARGAAITISRTTSGKVGVSTPTRAHFPPTRSAAGRSAPRSSLGMC